MDKSRPQSQQQQPQQTQQSPSTTKPQTTTNGNSNNAANLYSVRAMYLGSEPMGELLEGENGSDVIQVPLKRTILRTNGLGKEVELTVTHDSLQASGPQAPRLLKLPIELLAYCGALRQLPPEKIRTREFETLDKSPLVNSLNDEINPPLFVTIFRSLESENTLYCYSFVLRRDEEAMELVKVVMEIYYNLIRINEMDMPGAGDDDANENDVDGDEIINDDDLDIRKRVDDEDENKFDGRGSGGGGGTGTGSGSGNSGNNIDNSKSGQSLNEINGYSKTSSSDYLNELLNLYKKGSVNDADSKNKDKSVVSANDILQKSLDPNEYRIVNGNNDKNNNEDGEVDEAALKELNLLKDEYENVPLNEDEDPIIIKKPNNEEIVYKQNVFIRWLQPPTPPPPAPIIIREVQEPAPEQLPPLVIYKQAPRPVTPPPLIIRERPPSPLCTPTDPLIIERRVTVPERHRKIIIEHLPAPPPKPRDIILEKWLPREAPPPRTVFVQKAISNKISSSQYQRPVYEVIEHHQHPRRDLYEILDSTCSSSRMPAALASKQQYGSQMNTSGHHIHHHHHCAAKQQQHQQLQQQEANMLQLRRSSSNEFYHRAASATLHLNQHQHHHHHMQSPSSGIYSPVPTAAAAATTTTTTTHTVHHHMPVAPPPVIVPSVVTTSGSCTPAMIECSCSLIGKKGQHATSTSSMSTSSGAPKIAGYRIIRQIIPGPNSKPADIERALAASTTSSSQPPHIYSPPSYDTSFNLNLNNTAPIYSSSTVQQQAATAAAQSITSQQQHNIYCSSLNSASTTYCAYPRSMGSTGHPRPIILQQQQQQQQPTLSQQQQQQQHSSNGGTYSPHSNIYSPSSHHSQSQSATSSSTTTAPATSGLSSTSTTKARMFGQHLQQGGCTMNSAAVASSSNCCYVANCCKKRGELYRSSSIDNF